MNFHKITRSSSMWVLHPLQVPIYRAHGRFIGPPWMFRYPIYFVQTHNCAPTSLPGEALREERQGITAATGGRLLSHEQDIQQSFQSSYRSDRTVWFSFKKRESL